MKNEPLILKAEIIEKTGGARRHQLGMAFNHANMVKAVPVEVQSETYRPAETVTAARNRKGGGGSVVGDFLKPTLSNLFLLGCLLGLFVLYCCSCVIHALTFPTRRKSS